MKRANIIAQVLRYIKRMYEEEDLFIRPRIDKETVEDINKILKEKNGWYPDINIGFYLPLKENLTYDKDEINEGKIDKIEFIYHNKTYNMYDILEPFIVEIINYYKKDEKDKQPYYPSNIEKIIDNFLYYSNNEREKEEKLNEEAKNIVKNVRMQTLGLPKVPTHIP